MGPRGPAAPWPRAWPAGVGPARATLPRDPRPRRLRARRWLVLPPTPGPRGTTSTGNAREKGPAAMHHALRTRSSAAPVPAAAPSRAPCAVAGAPSAPTEPAPPRREHAHIAGLLVELCFRRPSAFDRRRAPQFEFGAGTENKGRKGKSGTRLFKISNYFRFFARPQRAFRFS